MRATVRIEHTSVQSVACATDGERLAHAVRRSAAAGGVRAPDALPIATVRREHREPDACARAHVLCVLVVLVVVSRVSADGLLGGDGGGARVHRHELAQCTLVPLQRREQRRDSGTLKYS